MSRIVFTLLATALVASHASAQQVAGTVMHPDAGCKATPTQLETNKKVAMAFFTPGADRVALADPSYKQHNPAFVKGGRDAGMTDFEYFKSRFGGPPQAARGGGPGRGQASGPQPPAGNPLEIVMAECDLVTIVHKNYRQDPTAPPGTGPWYEVFTFDVFRVRNGKLVEHWDGAVINPPAPAGGRGQ
jgi:predicted SnoaL-like aldol condensation-catalyzing enzyme